MFARPVKIVSHSSCRTSAIFKYFCPLLRMANFYESVDKDGNTKVQENENLVCIA